MRKFLFFILITSSILISLTITSKTTFAADDCDPTTSVVTSIIVPTSSIPTNTFFNVSGDISNCITGTANSNLRINFETGTDSEADILIVDTNHHFDYKRQLQKEGTYEVKIYNVNLSGNPQIPFDPSIKTPVTITIETTGSSTKKCGESVDPQSQTCQPPCNAVDVDPSPGADWRCVDPGSYSSICTTDPSKVSDKCDDLRSKGYTNSINPYSCTDASFNSGKSCQASNICVESDGTTLSCLSNTITNLSGNLTTGGGSTCSGANSVNTAIGCIPTDPALFVQATLTFVMGAAGAIALLLMISGAFQMVISAGNAENLKHGQEQFTSAIIGLLFVIFAVLLLQITGVDILKLPGFH